MAFWTRYEWDTNLIQDILTWLTFFGDLFIIVYLIFFNRLRKYVKKRALLFSFIVALIGILGSLYFSEILMWEPCKLCWFQRIFFYPMVLLLGLGLYFDDKKISRYVIPMAAIGALISAYHYIIQNGSLTCGETSCNIMYFFSMGYITIPMMALTGFILVILFLKSM